MATAIRILHAIIGGDDLDAMKRAKWQALKPLFVLGLLFVVNTATEAASVKIALAGEIDPDLQTALTAVLSRDPHLQVLERAELSSLVAESALGQGPPKVDGAEVVVFGSKQPDGTQEIRASEAWSGAVLQGFVVPKTLDPSRAADWIALRLRPWLRATPPETGKNFSLLGLRFDTDSPSHRQQERTMNLALAAALQASPQNRVLERWKLNDLVFEKSLLSNGSEPFWASAHLLDGRISELDGTWTVTLRDRNPGAKSERTVEVSGDDLSTIATHLTAALGEESKSATIDLPSEGQAFAEEAAWLLKLGLKREAVQAAETAVALGADDMKTEALRIRAYAESAYPCDLGTPQAGSGMGVERDKMTPDQIADRVALATTLSGLVCDYVKKFPERLKSRNAQKEDPAEVSVATLLPALCVLKESHRLGYSKTNPAPVNDLREMINTHIAAIRTLPLDDPMPFKDYRRAFYRYLISFSAYWNPTPEDTLRFLDEILSPGFAEAYLDALELNRQALRGSGYFHPPAIATPVTEAINYSHSPPIELWRVIDWSNSDDLKLARLWENYVREKLASSDPLTKADGLRLLFSSAASFNEIDTLRSRFVEALEEFLPALSGPHGAAISDQLIQGLRGIGDVRSNELRLRMVACYEQLLNSGKPVPDGLLSSLSIAVPIDIPPRMTPSEGEHLLASITTYESNFGGDEASQRTLAAIQAARAAVYRALPQLIPKPKTPLNRLGVTTAWFVAGHSPEEARPMPRFDDQSGLWAEGHLWFVDLADRKLWRIDPTTMKTTVLAGRDRPKPAWDDQASHGGPSNFGVRNTRPLYTHGKIFLPEQGDVWSYHIEENRWQRLNLPSGHYSLWLANGDLYATFGEFSQQTEIRRGEGAGVFRIDPDKETTELIFNTRRRPALHPLDEAKFDLPFGVLPGENGRPIVGLLGTLQPFRRLSDGQEVEVVNRRLLRTFTGVNGEALFAHTSRDKGNNLLYGIERIQADGKRETLLWNPEGKFPAPSDPVWTFPEELHPEPRMRSNKYVTAATHGNDLYLLIGERSMARWGSRNPDLYIFRRGEKVPVQITLTFSLALSRSTPGGRKIPSATPFENPMTNPYGLLALDAGIVITGSAMDGFWFIPRADLMRGWQKHEPSALPSNPKTPTP